MTIVQRPRGDVPGTGDALQRLWRGWVKELGSLRKTATQGAKRARCVPHEVTVGAQRVTLGESTHSHAPIESRSLRPRAVECEGLGGVPDCGSVGAGRCHFLQRQGFERGECGVGRRREVALGNEAACGSDHPARIVYFRSGFACLVSERTRSRLNSASPLARSFQDSSTSLLIGSVRR